MDIKLKNKIKQTIRWTSAGIIICILILIIFISRVNYFEKGGEYQFSSLNKPVQVIRDDKNLAYIYGQSMSDAIRVQGYVTAQDRLFQLMLTRLFVSGRIAELAGEKAVNLDVKNRTLGFYRNALKHEKILNSHSRDLLQAYTDGINEYIDNNPDEIPIEFKLAGIKPEKWQIIDSLAITYYMGWNSAANLNTEIISFLIINKIGFEKFKTIAPAQTGVDGKYVKPPLQNPEVGFETNDFQTLGLLLNAKNSSFQLGSNSWVVNNQLSKSGKPILANDPHLDTRILPGVFHPIGIITPAVRAVGVTVTGIPGVMIGRSQYVTAGMTNSYGDAQDLYIEKVDPNDHKNYLEGDQSIPFDTIHETLKYRDENSNTGYTSKNIVIRLTKRGPVITDVYPEIPKTTTLSIRWAAYESMQPDLGLDYMLTSKSVKDIRKAVASVNMIHINLTFADIDGNIGWQTTGKLPIRNDGDGTIPVAVKNGTDNWTGWIPYNEMPQSENPPSNWLGNANNRTIGADFPHYVSSYFSPRYRYERLKYLIEGSNQKHDSTGFWSFQRDISNELAKKIVPIFIDILQDDPDTKILAQALENWDYTDNQKKVGPVVFHYLFEKMAELTYTDELGEQTANKMLQQWYFWEEPFEKMILDGSSEWFDDIRTTQKVETLADIIKLAAVQIKKQIASDLQEDIHAWRWGKAHQIEFKNPIRRSGFGTGLVGGRSFAISGSGETLYRSIYQFQKPKETTISAALRIVVDLNDDDKFLAVIPGGVTGRTFDDHFKDQLDDYMSGKKAYWWFSDKMIKEHQKYKQQFVP